MRSVLALLTTLVALMLSSALLAAEADGGDVSADEARPSKTITESAIKPRRSTRKDCEDCPAGRLSREQLEQLEAQDQFAPGRVIPLEPLRDRRRRSGRARPFPGF